MENKYGPTTINISTLTIVKVIIVFLTLVFLYMIRDILAMLFVAIILASVIDPLADWFEEKKIPRELSVVLIYILLLLIFGGIIVLLIPPVFDQVTQLTKNFGTLWERVATGFFNLREVSEQYGILEEIKRGLESVQSGLGRAAGGVLSTVSNVFGGVASFVVVLVITFYMVSEDAAIKKLFRSLAPAQYQPYLTQLFYRIQQKIGLWVKGQLILSLIIFLLALVGLLILDVNYALILALLAGLMEFIPYVGPVLAAIPAVFLAFTESPLQALAVLILYFIIQQLENNIIVPKVMQKAVGLNPIVGIISILIGFKVAGVVGALLAIPVATAFGVFLEDFFQGENASESKEALGGK